MQAKRLSEIYVPLSSQSILKQEVAFFDRTRTGELINRLSADTTVVGHSITDNLSDGLRAVVQAAAGVSMMFYVSPSLACFVLLIVPPMAGLAIVYGKYLRSISKRTQDALAQTTQTGLSGNLMILSVLYKGGLLMASQNMTVGELSSFLMYTFWIGISIAGLSSFYSEMMKGFGAGARLWELQDRKPEFPQNEGLVLPSDQLKGQLEFYDVSFAYPTRKEAPIFQNLSLLVPAGTIMAVVGPSGSGKSSLVSLLLRLYDVDTGIITIDGHDIRDLNPYWLRSHIGTVSQNPKILLLDEATSALDAENESLVQEALERLMEGRTVIVIAHRLSTIQNANAVAVLDQRCIAECGQPAELLGNKQGLFRKLMEKQTFLQEAHKQALR
ncbi:ATP-binding cassette sub-family B member 10, mitochondrial [Larimichthys crocea]|uniref:Uncharacterized protein n=1 Tax=Larimichthys crocea TaxID=215358 RepID=A0ACD3R1R8_LARCR|nr:ATP-binding cassette sub-family B member 10, mitochondrial [Larimichthys crocea]